MESDGGRFVFGAVEPVSRLPPVNGVEPRLVPRFSEVEQQNEPQPLRDAGSLSVDRPLPILIKPALRVGSFSRARRLNLRFSCVCARIGALQGERSGDAPRRMISVSNGHQGEAPLHGQRPAEEGYRSRPRNGDCARATATPVSASPRVRGSASPGSSMWTNWRCSGARLAMYPLAGGPGWACL